MSSCCQVSGKNNILMVQSSWVQLGGALLGWFQPPSVSTAQFIETGYINRPQSVGKKTTADMKRDLPPHVCMCCFSTWGRLSLISGSFMRLVAVRFERRRNSYGGNLFFLELWETFWDAPGKMGFLESLTSPHWSADAVGRKTGRETISYFPWRRGRARKETHTNTSGSDVYKSLEQEIFV